MQEARQIALPTRVALAPASLYVELREIAAGELRDPLMQHTVNRIPAPRTFIEIPKAELSDAPAGAAPAGLIFHAARCGSTLVSQLLKHHEGVVVYSEPLPFNEILVPPHKWARAELVAALRALGGLFSRHAGRPYVLKLSSWNTLFCDLVAEAFPSTPWAFCIRDPIEVCVSLLQQRTRWVRDPRLFASIVDPAHAPEEYVARLFGAFCQAVRGLDVRRGLLVRYETLPDAIWRFVGPHFGLSIDEELRGRMAAASQTYSKAPIGKATVFVRDEEKKRAAASPALLRAIDAFARPEMERLAAAHAAA